jgi:pentatricopeptide repeat protein
MGSAEAIIELFALIAAVIFGYFQIIVPFLRGEVRLTRQWPFVEDVTSSPVEEIVSREKGEPTSPAPEDKKRVAHLMFADMVGYIPVKLEDDALALELLNEYVSLLRSMSDKHGGRELRVYGDEFLIEFPAPIEAAMCAIELQKALFNRNADQPEDRQIRVRAGIHSGELEQLEEDVTGEGVDVVTRVERLAGAGGISMTDRVYRRVQKKIGIPIIKLGRGARKEIRASHDVFKMILPWEEKKLDLSDRFSMAFQKTGNRVLTSIGALIIFFLVISVGYLTFTEEVESGEPIPIAVVDFVNETGEKELDGLSGMLITALEQSRRLSVLTRSRMFDVLKQLGREDVDHIDERLGREICRHADLNALVIASIRKFGQLYTIDLKVLDPDKDEYLFTTKEEGQGQESIPSMMDRLSEKTRIGLREKAEEIRLTSRSVAEVTTPSLEAYQHYFEGEQLIHRLKFKEARREFRKAITIDSTFALAHYRLAYAFGWEDESMAKEPLQKALELMDRIPEKERYYVRAEEARLERGFMAGVEVLREMEEIYPDDKEMLYNIGDWLYHDNQFKTAAEYLERVLKMDPTHERALQHLMWNYAQLAAFDEMRDIALQYTSIDAVEGGVATGLYLQFVGEYALAESTYKAVLDRDPEHPETLMRLAQLYGELGWYDEMLEYAREYASFGPKRGSNLILGAAYIVTGDYKKGLKKLQKAKEIAPQDLQATVAIAYFYLIHGEHELAREEFESLTVEEQLARFREIGLNGLIDLYVYLGKYRQAMQMYDKMIELEWEQNDTTDALVELMNKGHLVVQGWDDRDYLEDLINDIEDYRGKILSFNFWANLSGVYVILGDYDMAESISADRLGAVRWVDPFLRLSIHIEKGECEQVETGSSYLLSGSPPPIRIMILYALAECQLESGQYEEAISTLNQLQEIFWGDNAWAVFYPKSYYLLGKIYEEKGEDQLSISSYEQFLQIWSDADEDLPDLIDAKERLEALNRMAVK